MTFSASPHVVTHTSDTNLFSTQVSLLETLLRTFSPATVRELALIAAKRSR